MMEQGNPLPVSATASRLKPGDFPVGSLESRAAARAALDRAAEGAGAKFRVIAEMIGESLDLDQSTCQRYWAGGCLMEVVVLSGSADELSPQQLDEFVKRAPISSS